jgi:uncharacterized protein (DUF1684 family)
MRKRIKVALLISILILPLQVAGRAGLQEKFDATAYRKETEQWRAARVEEIAGEQGWMTLVGLFWLSAGENRFGSDPSNEIVLPRDRAPRLAGSLRFDGDRIHLRAGLDASIVHEGMPVSALELETDAEGRPTMFTLGTLNFFVIKRGERFALRVKDTKHPARSTFRGINYYPVDLKLRVEARFEAYNPPKTIPIANVLGMVDEMKSPGALVFEIEKKTYRLDALEMKGSDKLFIIFADRTSGRQTYGAGRYIYAARPAASGKVILDFNRAENPPCAFTSFATCPLPPRQNRLAVAIEAGEKKYSDSDK